MAQQTVLAMSRGALYIWDATSSALLLGPIKGHVENYEINHIFFITEEVFLSSSSDATIRQWDSRSGKPVRDAFTAHESMVQRATCLPDKRTAASISLAGDLLVWNVDTLQVLGDVQVAHNLVFQLAFSPDGTRLAAVQGSMLYVCDVERCQMMFKINVGPRLGTGLCSVAFTPDSRTLYLGTHADCIVVWDIEKQSFEEEVFLAGEEDDPSDIQCSQDGKLIACTTDSGEMYIWSVGTSNVVTRFNDLGPYAFSPDGQHLVRVLRDTTLTVNDLKQYLLSDSSSYLDLPAATRPTGSSEDSDQASALSQIVGTSASKVRQPKRALEYFSRTVINTIVFCLGATSGLPNPSQRSIPASQTTGEKHVIAFIPKTKAVARHGREWT
ncbi:hypothetical protein ID866_6888 [Astraeus odoratus]|nr:hypothetical protein ID866_6888 [Astraeus odoratus]